MDILKPRIIRVGNRRYRQNPISDQHKISADDEFPSRPYTDDVYEDEICDGGISAIEQQKDGSYHLALEIPSAYFKFIIGKKGETKRRLENETRTQIKIPRPGAEGDVVIIGHDKGGISSARTRIEVLVDSARQKQPFTHFLSIPVAAPDVQFKFNEFKNQVMDTCTGDFGIDASIFQNPLKLHLTIGTFALMNQKEISNAITLLKECQQSILQPLLEDGPLIGHMIGLEYMNDDPHRVDVLYAKVQLEDGSDRLQQLADELSERLTSSGVMQKDHERVKLHVTVMNSLFRKDPTGSNSNEDGVREPFDAYNVLQLFGEYDFGRIPINTVHLSERYSTQQDGYYKSAFSLNF